MNIISDIPKIFSGPLQILQIPKHCYQGGKKKCKVVLSGDGGDELFGGYNRYIYKIIMENFFYYAKKIKNGLLRAILLNLK